MYEFDPWDTNSSEFFPWAGRGLSWRGSDANSTSSVTKKSAGERCWYINMRNTRSGQYGIICVWDSDLDPNSRPYRGAPLLLDNNLSKIKWQSGTQQELGSALSWTGKDNCYSLAFSENGRSYMMRKGASAYNTKPSGETYGMFSASIEGNSHRFRAMSGNVHGKSGNAESQVSNNWLGVSVQSKRLPGNAANLISIKGNLSYTSYATDAKAPITNNQSYAFMYRLPTYAKTPADRTIRVRRDRIQDFYDQGYNRLEIVLKSGDEITTQTGDNYIIPMAGYERADFVMQLNNNFFAYIYHNDAKNFAVSSNGQAADNNSNQITNYKRLSIDKEYIDLVGGCSFEYKGEVFLVLPHTRPDGTNHGDFTIFRVENRDSDVRLEPVYDYYCRKDGTNPSASVKRTFITSEVYADYVNIFTYLPGRMIAKYTLNIPPRPRIQPTTSVTFSKEQLPHNASYRPGNFSSGINRNYERVKALDLNASWDYSEYTKFQSWEGLGDNTPWFLEGYQAELEHNNVTLVNNQYAIYGKDATGNYSRPAHPDNRLATPFYCTVRPVLVRKHNGFIEHMVGTQGSHRSELNYEPQNPQVRVKAFEGVGDAKGKYRIDLWFSRPNPVYVNGVEVPVDHYEIYRVPNGSSQEIRVTQFNTIVGNSNMHYEFIDKNESKPGYSGYNPDTYDPDYNRYHYGNYMRNQNVIYGDYNFEQWPAVMTGIQDNQDNSVLSFYSTDPTVTKSKYIVKPVYCATAPNLRKTGYGEATPTSTTTTGVENIGQDADTPGQTRYFNLQGIEVQEENLTPGIYIMLKNSTTQKIRIQ